MKIKILVDKGDFNRLEAKEKRVKALQIQIIKLVQIWPHEPRIVFLHSGNGSVGEPVTPIKSPIP